MTDLDHVIDELLSFKDFIPSITRNEGKLKKHAYLVTGVIQTYYEYLACILEGKITPDNKVHSKRLADLKSNGVISSQQFEILNRTRKFRNKLLHDLTYRQSLEEVIDFYKVCLPNTNTGNLSTPEMLEIGYVHGIVNGYCFMEGSLMKALGESSERIEEKLSQQTHAHGSRHCMARPVMRGVMFKGE